MSCLNLEIIERYATGALVADERGAAERHITACDRCRERFAEVQDNLRAAAQIERARADGAMKSSLHPAASPTATVTEAAFVPGAADSIPGYQIVREISRGGQGVVYQAIQKATKRRVAIKVLREGHFASAAERARFQREVEILGSLKHPNIVTIYDSGAVRGHAYYVMDYISGEPLDEYVETVARPRSPKAGTRALLGMFVKVCDAIHAAHLRGIMHRDLKPGNIRVDAEGEPHVLDFGLAKVTSDPEAGSPAMTMTGQFVGSLPWSSPEQAEGIPSKIDVRTDVYSLGVMLYQMLTGRFPYDVSGSMPDVLERIMRSEPVRPSAALASRVVGGDLDHAAPPVPRRLAGGRGRRLDADLETIVLKALAKERGRRYQSAGELARDLRHYLSGEPIDARRDSLWYYLRKSVVRSRGAMLVLMLVAALVVGCLGISAYFLEEKRQAVKSYQDASAEQLSTQQKYNQLTAQLLECQAAQRTVTSRATPSVGD